MLDFWPVCFELEIDAVVVVVAPTVVLAEPETVVDVVDPVVAIAMTGDAFAAVGAEVTMPVVSLLFG